LINTANIKLLGNPKNNKEFSFEECYDAIDKEIKKRKPRWLLNRLMDYEDVSQVIRNHIFIKWDQWDQSRTLLPWINRVITHQTKNIVRNIYSCYSKPCSKCEANEERYGGGEGLCRIYKTQCADCPLYAKWEKSKKNAQNINLAESYDGQENYIKTIEDDSYKADNLYKNLDLIHISIMAKLTPAQKKVYKYLYIDHKDKLETAKLMGYRTKEASRDPGYKAIEKFKKIFVIQAKKVLEESDFSNI